MILCVSICAQVHVNAHETQRSVSDPLLLEVQVFVSHLLWVLGTYLVPSVRAV